MRSMKGLWMRCETTSGQGTLYKRGVAHLWYILYKWSVALGWSIHPERRQSKSVFFFFFLLWIADRVRDLLFPIPT
jgi:hypothetical protein